MDWSLGSNFLGPHVSTSIVLLDVESAIAYSVLNIMHSVESMAVYIFWS